MAIGGTAMLAAVVKASRAAITTDEAWSFNDWSSRDFATVFGDYHAPNNHVLHTALVRASFLLLGPSEPALRVPALFGFAAVIVATGLLARDMLRRPGSRLAALTGVALHPFVVDFGACARGYSLGLGFGLLALWGLGRSARGTPASVRWGAAAGLAAGLSVGTVLAFANLVLAVAIAALVGLRGGIGRRAWPFAVSAFAVLAATYGRLLEQIGAAHLRFGAPDARTSFASLLHLLVYTPQSLVDAAGQPLVAGEIVSWRPNVVLDTVDAVLTTPAAEITLALVVAVSVWSAWLRRRADAADPAALPGLTLGAFLAIVSVQGVLFAVPWPFHRTWLAAVPLLVLAATAAAERWLDQQPTLLRRRYGLVLGTLWVVWLVLGCARFDPTIYREWPDNAVVPEAVAEVARRRDPGDPVELGHVWYLDACLRYYRTRDGLDWLRLADRPTAAEVPGPPFILASRRMEPDRYPGYAVVARWDALAMTLLQRRGAP